MIQGFDLPSLPCFGSKQPFTSSSWTESRLPSAILSLTSPPINQGTYIPCVRLLGWDAQSVALTTHSPGRCPPVLSPFSSESPPSGTSPDLITSFPFLANYVTIFLTALFIYQYLCQFSARIVSHVDISFTCLSGEVSSASSYSPILIWVLYSSFCKHLCVHLNVYIVSDAIYMFFFLK